MPEMPQTDLEQLVLYRPVSTFQPGRKIKRPVQYGKFYTYFTNNLPLAIGAVSNRNASFTSDGKYLAFAVQKIASLADTLAVRVLPVIQPSGEQFAAQEMLLTHYGGGQFPRIVHPAWIIRKNNILTLTMTDAQAAIGAVPAVNNVRVAYFGQKIQQTPIVAAMEYNAAKQFSYPASFTALDLAGPLPPNAIRTATITVDADSDFEVQAITVASMGPVAIQVQTDADNWFDTDIRSELLGGSLINPIVPPIDPSGWHPFIMPAPRWIMGAGYIKCTITNLVGGEVSNPCEVQFHGVRLYPAGGLR